ncbi:MAG: hypothetical protein M1819_001117 [Sarea resinae]|nr:MAG: hypothetical protein M1819_001117 [Sarea resinae]
MASGHRRALQDSGYQSLKSASSETSIETDGSSDSFALEWQSLLPSPVIPSVVIQEGRSSEVPRFMRDESGVFNQLTKLLQFPGLDSRFNRIVSTVINMIQHIHLALFNPLAEHQVHKFIMEHVISLADDIITIFVAIKNDLSTRLDKFNHTKLFLPTLETVVDAEDLRMGLQLWIEKMRAIKPLAPTTALIFRNIAWFYEEKVYHSFLQTRVSKPEHGMRHLTGHLNALYTATEDVYHLSSQLVRDTAMAKFSIEAACGRLDKCPLVWKEERLRSLHLCAVANRVKKTEELLGQSSEGEGQGQAPINLINKTSRASREERGAENVLPRIENELVPKDSAAPSLKRTPATRRPSRSVAAGIVLKKAE